MKRSFKTILGVTLLEIMLVLAIAAMVIVMSIRYYQSATLQQKLNAAVNAVTAVMAAGENYLAANGGFTGMSDGSVSPYLPQGKLPPSPWGGTMSVSGAGASSYEINVPGVPVGACPAFTNLFKGNAKLVVAADCAKVTVNS